MQTNTEKITEYYKSDPEGYEKMLLAGVLRVESVWVRMKAWLCHETAGGSSYVNDFTNNLHYVFYLLLQEARVLSDGAECAEGEFAVPSLDMMHLAMKTKEDDKGFIRQLSALPDDCIDTLYSELTSKYSDDELKKTVLPTCLAWLQRRKLETGVTKISLDDSSGSPSAQLNRLQGQLDAIGSADDEDEFHTIGDNGNVQIVERMPVGAPFLKFDISLGGGLGKKEHIIVCAPTGQGKTIFACQLAATAAAKLKQVLFISTEQDHVETEPRFISCCSKWDGLAPIKYELIKDGVDDALDTSKKLTDAQRETVVKIRGRLAPYLHMVNWQGGEKTVYDIPMLVRRAKNRFGNIDIVILDWIGAALEDSSNRNKEKRELYQEAAVVMKNVAFNENVATVSMAQTTRDSIGVKMINESHLAECKSLHWQATAAYGISALRKRLTDADLDNSDGQAVFETRQYMHAFKSRKSRGIVFPIERDFDYQRFSQL